MSNTTEGTDSERVARAMLLLGIEMTRAAEKVKRSLAEFGKAARKERGDR